MDEDPFEKQIRVTNETNTEQLRVSTEPKYVKPQNIGLGVCQDTLMSTKRTLMSCGCGDSSMVVLHLESG